MLKPLIPVVYNTKRFLLRGSFAEIGPNELQEIYEIARERGRINVALRLDNFVALDADDDRAERFITELEVAGELPPTLAFKTRRGFKRLYLRQNGIVSGQSDPSEMKLEVHVGPTKTAILPPSVVDNTPYTWLSGQSPEDLEPVHLPEKAWQIIRSKLRGAVSSVPNVGGGVRLNLTHGNRNNSIFQVLSALAKQYPPEDLLIVGQALAQYADGPPMGIDEIKSIVKSAHSRNAGGLIEQVRAWVNGVGGIFSTKDIYQELSINEREDRKIAREVLVRLEEEGLIERWGSKSGVYRTKNYDAAPIDFLSANPDETTIDIKLPFEAHKFIKLFPKSVIVIAGASNAGKTAFMLNIVRMNMFKHDIHYISSEMDAVELRERLNQFDDITIKDWKFNAYLRSHNVWDIVQPDAINLIDYLEVEDNFYEVGKFIRMIFDRLKNGVAVIALQKAPGQELGLGGRFSLDKARLYLSLDSGVAKIIKAKNWATNVNPNGLKIRWKLIRGCKFVPQGDWYKEEEE